MLVLFDNGTPRTLARYLIEHHTVTEARARMGTTGKQRAFDRGRDRRVEVVVTTDRNLRYQQNLAGRKIAIVVLGKGRWTLIKPRVAEIVALVNAATPGSYAEIEIPG